MKIQISFKTKGYAIDIGNSGISQSVYWLNFTKIYYENHEVVYAKHKGYFIKKQYKYLKA